MSSEVGYIGKFRRPSLGNGTAPHWLRSEATKPDSLPSALAGAPWWWKLVLPGKPGCLLQNDYRFAA
jgi:hypothetical protein